MKRENGLERVFHGSLGVEIGANGIALLAVLEFKNKVQNGLRGVGSPDFQLVSISSEEWRISAGIFERKAYERAKAKLLDRGIVHIDREGRMLRVTLWPESISESSHETRIQTPSETKRVTLNETHKETPNESSPGSRNKARSRTSNRTSSNTADATSRGTNVKPSQPPRPGIAGLQQGVNFPMQVLSQRKRYRLRRYSFFRYSLSHYSVSPSKVININDLRSRYSYNPKDEQRNNEQRSNEKRESAIQNKGTPLMPNPGASVNDVGPDFKQLWQSEIGHALTRYELEGLQRFLRLGYTVDVLREALRCAVLADQRHMGYVLGILRNWYREGVRELEDIPLIQQSWQDRRFLERSRCPV